MADPLVQAIDDAIQKVDEIRLELHRLKRLVVERLGIANVHEELTPVRPPSQAAMEAFKNSADFASGRKKPSGG